MAQSIDRRHFLAGVLGTAALAGCSSGSRSATALKSGRSASAASSSAASSSAASNGASLKSTPFSLLADTFQYFTGIDQRVAVALVDNKTGNPLNPSGAVTIAIGPQNGPLGPPEPAAFHTLGLTNGYLKVVHRFDTPGNYTVRATYQGHQDDLAIQVIRPGDTPIPTVGKPLISAPTPTTTDTLGVNPICTRNPPCPFHEVNLETAIAQNQMIALMFATPALCQSRLCGPVLDNLIAVHAPFAGKVTFIHNEIYTDLSGKTGTPAVQAYHLENEPLLYFAGTDHVVRERLDNASDQTEQHNALTRLVGATSP